MTNASLDTITINGKRYVPEQYADMAAPDNWEHVCVIATNGWIFEGYRDPDADEHGIALMGAHVVRKWSNGLGIGGLADPEHKDDYTLDKVGHVLVHNVVAVIELGW